MPNKIVYDDRDPIGTGTFPLANSAAEQEEIARRLARPRTDRTKDESVLYVHIPFCEYICTFCALNRVMVKDTQKELYLQRLIDEIAMYARTPYIQSLTFKAFYMGGGTPTTFTPAQMSRLLGFMRANLNFHSEIEITCEGTTHSFTEEMVDCLKAHGVARISTGIQSFDTDLRKTHLGIPFTKEQTMGDLERIKKHFTNFNIDLIYNLPEQSEAVWAADLQSAIGVGSTHLTMNPYVHLRNTKLHTKEKKGQYGYPEQEQEIRFFDMALDALRGTHLEPQYSVRDWSLEDKYCRYIVLNSYSSDVIAFGCGAYGYIDGCSYKNFSKVPDYIAAVERGFPMESYYLCTQAEKMQRYMVMGMRLQHLRMAPFEERFGAPWRQVFGEILDDLEYSGFIEIDQEKEIIHTTGQGMVWGNNMRSEFADTEKFSFVGYGLIGDGDSGRGNYF